MSKKHFRAWITKYALTSGVFVADAEVSDTSDRMICVKGHYYHGEGRDWHRTRESAIDRVREMRVAKLTSLHKQIAKLEAAEIEVPE